MAQTRKQKARQLKRLAGRQTWEIKPIEKVVPNKKKAKPTRKAKHKGRQHDAGLFCLPSGANIPGSLKEAGVTPIRGKIIRIARASIAGLGT